MLKDHLQSIWKRYLLRLCALIIFNARLRVLMLGLLKLRLAVAKSCFMFFRLLIVFSIMHEKYIFVNSNDYDLCNLLRNVLNIVTI